MSHTTVSPKESSIEKSLIIGNLGRFKQRDQQMQKVAAGKEIVVETRSQEDPTASSSFSFSYTSLSGENNQEIESTPLHPLLANCEDFMNIDNPSTQGNQTEKEQYLSATKVNEMGTGRRAKMKQSVPYPIVNSTLRSQGSGSIVLVKIVEENHHQIINDPIKIAKLITNSIFDIEEVKDIRTDKRRATIVIEMVKENTELVKQFLAVTQLELGTGELIKVECCIPRNEMYKFGVISPVSTTTLMEELMELTKMEDGYPHKVVKMERLKKKTEDGWVDSTAIKITIAGKLLPKALKIGYSYFQVRPYVTEPVQCYRCHRMGHKSGICTARERCLRCGGNHNKKDCTSGQLRCVHCGGPHTANSRECAIIAEARHIEKRRAYHNENYLEARREVIRSRGQTGYYKRVETGNQASMVQGGQQTYSTVVQSTDNHRGLVDYNYTGQIQYKNQSTQTGNGDKQANNNLALDDEFFRKLKNCFLELLEAHIDLESTHKKETMIESAIGIHFRGKRIEHEVINQQTLTDETNNRNKNKVHGNTARKRTSHTVSDDEGVLSSHSDNGEDDGMFKTVEKRQLLINKTKKSKTKRKKP